VYTGGIVSCSLSPCSYSCVYWSKDGSHICNLQLFLRAN